MLHHKLKPSFLHAHPTPAICPICHNSRPDQAPQPSPGHKTHKTMENVNDKVLFGALWNIENGNQINAITEIDIINSEIVQCGCVFRLAQIHRLTMFLACPIPIRFLVPPMCWIWHLNDIWNWILTGFVKTTRPSRMPSRKRIWIHCSFLYWTKSGDTSSIWSINSISGFVLLLSVCSSSLKQMKMKSDYCRWNSY